jgi:hypothetical protein
VSKTFDWVKIPAFAYSSALAGARLVRLAHETHGQRRDMILDFDEVRRTEPTTLLGQGGQVWERVQGELVPQRLRFVGVRDLECSGLYQDLLGVPMEHGARSLRGVLTWQLPGKRAMWAVFHGPSAEPAELMLSAWRCQLEARPGAHELIDQLRDWSPTPSMPARRVAVKKRVHSVYGGDPVAVELSGARQPRRLFIGGLNEQSDKRPTVDTVLNLGDDDSRWVAGGTLPDCDRRAREGEGPNGMRPAELATEADWVIERLRAGQRVLVHCSGGTNRSVSVCCSVLIRLEGLTAEAALARVREHHPWALPDPYHWLALKWLAKSK